MALLHELKTWPEAFHFVRLNLKKFEVRKNDRGFMVDDTLLLREWNPETESYTGRKVKRRVTYITQGKFGLPADICVMSIEPVPEKGSG